ncbi:MAG: hypothetical protein COY40_04765 [Alphaproteobacteria bacterium CG_4_10_14_0_8_um_filter_53_9]|nr:MAG: hypothetical protein COY40_04765 [Alphaproteobacteria bacterium CG_4_10_14_0_8_um_filter_53_9]
MIIQLTIVFICTFGSVFFSMSETALMAVSRAKLHAMVRERSRPAIRLLDMLDRPDKMLATILLGNNVVNILSSALVTGLLIQAFGPSGVVYATAMMTVVILIFCEILPKTIATRYPERIALAITPTMRAIIWVCTPLTYLIHHINTLIFMLFRTQAVSGKVTTAELRGAIHLSLKQGAIKRSQHQMLDAILELDTLTVADVMLHRSAIELLDVHTPPVDIPGKLAGMMHTRVPVYEGSPENILGILTVRDYLGALAAVPNRSAVTIRAHLQPAYYVPETTIVSHQLRQFLLQHRHLALVVDEYGSLEGLVTLEDILEEIVGNIGHEHEPMSTLAKADEKGHLTLPGEMPIRTVNRLYNFRLPDDHAVTLAGLMIEHLGHLPVQGESITLPSHTLTVETKRGHRLETITLVPVVEGAL